MAMSRTLRLGCAGEDVLRLKQRLLENGSYDPRITQITTNVFGRDTRNAVMNVQAQHALKVDGIVGELTYAVLFPEEAAQIEQTRGEVPANIGSTAASAIEDALKGANAKRREIVLDALSFAYDPAIPREYPVSLYIRGGNLYNTDLAPNVISIARIRSGAKRQPEYYDGGRQEMMERAVKEDQQITGADCSGGVVGLLRHAGVVKPTFDMSADGFYRQSSMHRIEQEELQPFDLLHKSGHIGLYAGGGYAVEWMGGAYGCQLTRLTDRRGWNFVKNRTDRFGAWTSFLRPGWY